jgi:hypothetical protein
VEVSSEAESLTAPVPIHHAVEPIYAIEIVAFAGQRHQELRRSA